MTEFVAIEPVADTPSAGAGGGEEMGVQVLGQRNYQSILRQKEPILSKVMGYVMDHASGRDVFEDIQMDYLPLYMEEYMDYLKKNGKLKKYFPYENTSGVEVKKPEQNSTNQKGKNNREEVARYTTMMSNFTDEFANFLFDNELVIPKQNFGFKYQIHFYLYMNEWMIRMYKAVDAGKAIPMKNILNCVISYSRSIQDLNRENLYGNDFQTAYRHIFDKLMSKLYKKYERNPDEIYPHIFRNPDLILESFWDLGKPKSFVPYKEQMEILQNIMGALITDSPTLLLYKVPPGGGKTMWSVVMARRISEFYFERVEAGALCGADNLLHLMKQPQYVELKNKVKIGQEKLKKTHPDFQVADFDREVRLREGEGVRDQTKYLLYICYNDIVRTEVASLCNAEDVNLPFWMATSEHYGDVIDTLLRPFKSCYADWKKAKRYRLDPMRFAPLEVQWAHFQNATHNRPAMVIADLHSAWNLIQAFPDRFVVYFDETFAGAENEIVIKILSILPRQSVLLSATLPEVEEIPQILTHIRTRHSMVDEQIRVIRSNRLHVSCTIVGEDGNLYLPHNFVENLTVLESYIENIESDPLKFRCYSPQMVYMMVNHIKTDLPSELSFQVRFREYGQIQHEDIRRYAMEVLRYVAHSGNDELFMKMRTYTPNKMENMDKTNLLTTNAYHYQAGNTLHVSSFDAYKPTVDRILDPILSRAPRLDVVIQKMNEEKEENKKLMEEIKSDPAKFFPKKGKDSKSRVSRQEIQAKLDELETKKFRLKWIPDLVINSMEHGKRYGDHQIYNPTAPIPMDVEKIKDMDPTTAKLLLCGIGLYNPDEMTKIDLETFLEHRNDYRFIFSTPAIVYGTNMSISNVDIDESFQTSRNSIYQLMGRAGRRGKKSFNAMVVFHDQNILRMVMNRTFRDVEAEIAEARFHELILAPAAAVAETD